MKITKNYLKHIIKEELEKVIEEQEMEEGFFSNLFGKKGSEPQKSSSTNMSQDDKRLKKYESWDNDSLFSTALGNPGSEAYEVLRSRSYKDKEAANLIKVLRNEMEKDGRAAELRAAEEKIARRQAQARNIGNALDAGEKAKKAAGEEAAANRQHYARTSLANDRARVAKSGEEERERRQAQAKNIGKALNYNK